MKVDQLVLTRPDDAHLHLRDGTALEAVISDSARQFKRAIIMPNLAVPVDTVEKALAYRDRIIAAKEKYCPNSDFEPLMTLYLTDQTTPEDIFHAQESGFIKAVKLYPSHATTNSASGVTDIQNRYPVFAAMATAGMVLSIHGEYVSPKIDIFDREGIFLDKVLAPLLDQFSDLRVVLEHVTTQKGVEFVRKGGENLAGTLTAHHLLLNRNALFEGGLKPHHYCLPVLKRESDREALLEAATSGLKRFFLGTDSAPHPQASKESACGCAGIYTAHAALEFYAEAFDSVGRLDRLESFAAHFAADFYRLPRNTETVLLIRSPWTVPNRLPYGSDCLIPFKAGKTVAWCFKCGENN